MEESMQIEKGRIVNDFLEPNKKQYVIPVYQRNYSWEQEQCEKLFVDILNAQKEEKAHFCGSVVYAPLKSQKNIDYYVIVDGQQRLTSIYLLIKALIDCAETDKEKYSLQETLLNNDKYDSFDVQEASKLKLKPIKSDNQQLYLLMEDKFHEIDKSSGIWINYSIFKEMIKSSLNANDNIGVKDIYRGIERLTCAKILLDDRENAQEIFERINSTGVPLSLSDQIRNFVLMTDLNQEILYEKYWLKIEQSVTKDNMSSFLLDYLNLKVDGFQKESQAYDSFKQLFQTNNYSNESMLVELEHYSNFYSYFQNGSKLLSSGINKALNGLKNLKQTTLYPFLFKVFDDYDEKIINDYELERVLKLFLNYSIRRLICEVNSNSLRGLYKTLYNRVFIKPDYKNHYYDSLVSFLKQLTSRDAILSDEDFLFSLKHNNLYRKYVLCRYLLIEIENQGKEKISTDKLSIEHIMPQNKNLSTSWQVMLGDNWIENKDRWLHTLGNLTLTGYNSELGDKPFLEKKRLILEAGAKAVILNKDIQKTDVWNAETIQQRGEDLSKTILKLYQIEEPKHVIKFIDPRYTEYTCADSTLATFKSVNYYVLEGERVTVTSFKDMLISVASKLYLKDKSVIEKILHTKETNNDFLQSLFSYNPFNKKSDDRIVGTNIFVKSGLSASSCIDYIRELLDVYELNIDEDFVYSAKQTGKQEIKLNNENGENVENLKRLKEFWEYALPIIKETTIGRILYNRTTSVDRSRINGLFGIQAFSIDCFIDDESMGVSLEFSGRKNKYDEMINYLLERKHEIESILGVQLNWNYSSEKAKSNIEILNFDYGLNTMEKKQEIVEYFCEWIDKFYDIFVPHIYDLYAPNKSIDHQKKLSILTKKLLDITESKKDLTFDRKNSTIQYVRFTTKLMSELLPDTDVLSEWRTPNHYFYEIVPELGIKFRIQLAFNGKYMPLEQRLICEKIMSMLNKKLTYENWNWMTSFKTSIFKIEDDSVDSLEKLIDLALLQVKDFELQIREEFFPEISEVV